MIFGFICHVKMIVEIGCLLWLIFIVFMKKIYFALILSFIIPFVVKSQLKYTAKLEVGYQNFLQRNFEVDPGPDWKGYDLGEDLGAFDVSLVNGISYRDNLRLGFGVGYLNYNRNINGYTLFGDLEYVFASKKVRPLLNLKVGRNYITNDYQQEEVPFDIVDVALGIETKIKQKLSGQLKVGLNFVGVSYQFLPIRLGLRF